MKLKKLIDLFFFVALLTIFSNKLYANPQEFISQLTSDASKILASSQSKEDKMIALIDLAEQNVDIEGIGMYTLGKHRKSLNEKQTEEYKLLFRKTNNRQIVIHISRDFSKINISHFSSN